MKKLFQNRGIRWLGISVLILLLSIAYTGFLGRSGHTSSTSSFIGAVTTPMQWMATQVSDWLEGMFDSADRKTLEELRKKVEELEAQIQTQNEQLVEYYDLKEENERMQTALNVKEEYPEWEVVGASVVAKDPNDLFCGFTINKGMYSGIQVGDPVVTEDGLVGIVSRVSAVYAKVDTIFHPDVRISCYGLQSKDYGILRGDKELCDRNLVQMTDLETKVLLKTGDLVITSGLGGAYPDGVVVGYVGEVTNNNVDISLTATIRPAVQIRTLDEVVVVTDFPGRGELASDLNNEEK